MCGICGFFNSTLRPEAAHGVVSRMAATLKSRGPDEEGFLSEEGLAFGHRRLNVIDL